MVEPFLGSGTELIFSQNLFRRPTPTCIVCRISFRILYVGAPD
ncbi:hypothetical protein HMPREF0774_1224 [Staphylococcus aureus subsp. aureus TCH130]|nr:hypothetical protein HMPREF0774_1224 [Staphylococcus aureus subsp. aureus TCH130]